MIFYYCGRINLENTAYIELFTYVNSQHIVNPELIVYYHIQRRLAFTISVERLLLYAYIVIDIRQTDS